jgi:hypothetical protein
MAREREREREREGEIDREGDIYARVKFHRRNSSCT